MSRFLHGDAMLPSERTTTATTRDGDGFEDPPELVPGFMPTVRRVLSRFLNPKKKRPKTRRVRGLRALLARTGFHSKFLAGADPPPAPKPAPPKPPKAAASPTGPKPPSPRTLRGKFNGPRGP